MNVSFCVPICYNNAAKTVVQTFFEWVDDYFYLGGVKGVVREGEGVELVEQTASWILTVIKVASYFFLIIPLIMGAMKIVLRSIYSFHIIPPRVEIDEPVEAALPEGMQIEALPSDLLLTPTYQAIFEKFYKGKERNHVIAAALWLLGIASVGESIHIPEVLTEMEKDFREISGHDIWPRQPLVKATIRFFEKVKKVNLRENLQTPSDISQLILDRVRHVYFHGTHVCNMKSICEHGLSIHHVGQDPKIDRLHKIALEALRQTMIFGYRYINCITEETGQKKTYVFLSACPYRAADYALRAPEWAGEFFTPDYYSTRNKEQAHQWLEMRLFDWKQPKPQRPRPLTTQEAQEFREVFEETWEKYKELKPVVFRVLDFPERPETSEELLNEAMEFVNGKQQALEWLIEEHLRKFDLRIDRSIAPSRVVPFFIPV